MGRNASHGEPRRMSGPDVAGPSPFEARSAALRAAERAPQGDGDEFGLASWIFEIFKEDTPSQPRGAIRPSFAYVFVPLEPRGRREGRVPARTRGPLREMHTQREPHSSIQVWPITRPSLRGGRTAYAVLSREPNFPSGLPRRSNWRCRPPGRARAHLRSGLTVATTARTTRFCRTHGPPCRRSFSSPVDEAGNLQARRNLTAPLVRTRPRAHGDTPPCPHLSCRRCRVHRKPGSRN